MTKAYCPWCNKLIALTSRGVLRKHFTGSRWAAEWAHCPGSGNPPESVYPTPILKTGASE